MTKHHWLSPLGGVVLVLMTSLQLCSASTCQSQGNCDCNFEIPDSDATVRYEVMSGLVGAFSPLLVAGLGYVAYKTWCSKPSMMGPAGGGNPLASWRDPHTGGVNHFPDPRRGSTPISVYGETEDDFLDGKTSSRTDSPMPGIGQGQQTLRPNVLDHRVDNDVIRPGTSSSRYTNVHRNVKSDKVNQWFKNVNAMK